MDVMTDGKAWHWAVASVVAVVVLMPVLPLALAAMALDRARREAWSRS